MVLRMVCVSKTKVISIRDEWNDDLPNPDGNTTATTTTTTITATTARRATKTWRSNFEIF